MPSIVTLQEHSQSVDMQFAPPLSPTQVTLWAGQELLPSPQALASGFENTVHNDYRQAK